MLRPLLLSWLFLAASHTAAFDLSSLSNKDASVALKETLNRSTTSTLALLGQQDGYLNNPKVRIPLPSSLQKMDGMLRKFGLGAQSDALLESINRSAEQAVQQAQPVLLDAIKKMTITDARDILMGGNTAATDYFVRTTRSSLSSRFLPIVKKSTNQLMVAEKYNQYAGKAAALGLLKTEEANLDQYITQKALDGLYLTLAEQEQALRADPVKQGSQLLRKIFGSN